MKHSQNWGVHSFQIDGQAFTSSYMWLCSWWQGLWWPGLPCILTKHTRANKIPNGLPPFLCPTSLCESFLAVVPLPTLAFAKWSLGQTVGGGQTYSQGQSSPWSPAPATPGCCCSLCLPEALGLQTWWILLIYSFLESWVMVVQPPRPWVWISFGNSFLTILVDGLS